MFHVLFFFRKVGNGAQYSGAKQKLQVNEKCKIDSIEQF